MTTTDQPNFYYEDHFINYFAICGLASSGQLDVDPLCAKFKADSSPLCRSYVGKVLAHYPRARRSCPFHHEILTLCLPHGLRFCTQKESRDPTFHSFANIHADGRRVDGCVLTFYEEVKDSRVCQALHSLQTEHFAVMSQGMDQPAERPTMSLLPSDSGSTGNSSSGGGGRLGPVGKPPRSPKIPPASSNTTLKPIPTAPVDLDTINSPQDSLQSGGTSGQSAGSSHTLPKRGRSARSRRSTFYDIAKDTLYVTKCICVSTPIPIIYAADKLLRGLHNIVNSSNPETLPVLPLECYVYWMLHEIPCPPPGRSLKFTFNDDLIVCQRPSSDEFPFFDYAIHEAIDLIGVEKFLKVYTCVLLEQQVLLCSKKLHRLMLLAECLSVLLFPFRWHHVYVPILPYAQECFLEAPLPFIMGLQVEDGGIPSQVLQSNICVVDIDKGRIELPEDIPSLPDRNELIHEILMVIERYKAPTQGNTGGQQKGDKRAEWNIKRMSKSFDDDTVWLSPDGTPVDPYADSGFISPPTDLPLDVLQRSEPLAKVTAIARKAGVNIALIDSLQQELENNGIIATSPTASASCQRYFWTIRTNNAFREIFLNRFLYLLFSYESFIVGSYPDRDTYLNNREMVQNFDKTAFLSDQPESHLSFLAAFIETQMFTSFIDMKVLSEWDKPEEGFEFFENRMAELRTKFGDAMVRTPTYETCQSFGITESMILDREESSDYIVPTPHPLENLTPDVVAPFEHGIFPVMHSGVLEGPMDASKRSPWKQRYQRHVKERERMEREDRGLGIPALPSPGASPARSKGTISSSFVTHTSGSGNPYRHSYHPGMEIDLSPAQIAQTNWKFVEQLLRETKAKTKKMLVERLGKEAVELGHADVSVAGIEENTLVASFCDLLERVWSHGLNRKKGKSALWSHLLSSHDILKGILSLKPSFTGESNLPPKSPHRYNRGSTTDLSPSSDWSGGGGSAVPGGLRGGSPAFNMDSPSKRSSSRPRTLDMTQLLEPLPTEITYDLKNVMRMTEIKTDIGYARGFVRLALERRLLHKHLKTLLSNQDLLRSLYRRYAFLRCEEEREQFMYHILSLNAADYRCFTNSFPRTKMHYHVVLVAGGKLGTASTANLWVRVGGSLGQTNIINVPKNRYRFTFEFRNLGIISTIRVGHDNCGISPRLYLDFVLMRNDITGHGYKFPCGRWLGRGVDDDSIERLLVAEPLPTFEYADSLCATMTPPRTRSPSLRQLIEPTKIRISEVQQWLGDAVNKVVKHFYRPNMRRSGLTQLLCGERGLIWCLEQAFLVGFRSSRFFRQTYPWDYVEKVSSWFSDLLMEDCSQLSTDQRILIGQLCYMSQKLNEVSTLGKVEKFNAFLVIAIRDHILAGILPLMAWTPITTSMYEDISFLRSPHYLTFLAQLLSSLNDFEFNLEQSLTWGIDI